MIDCEDSSECCSNTACVSSLMCMSVFRLRDALSGTNPITDISKGDFFDRILFLIDDNTNMALQRYVDRQLLDRKRVSVLRGRVLSHKGGPLDGVRVSNVDAPSNGFSLTRRDTVEENLEEGGQFDLVVNGGGLVRILLVRQPYRRVIRQFYVPWNEIVYVGDVYMDDLVDEKIVLKQNGNFIKSFLNLNFF